MPHAPLSALALSSLLLCSCATESDKRVANQDVQCRNDEPATGTLVARRERCVVVSDESREAARRQLEQMQQEQERGRTASKQKGG